MDQMGGQEFLGVSGRIYRLLPLDIRRYFDLTTDIPNM